MGESLDNTEYSDIIDLPRHVSSKHPQMSMMNRAGQFAPFAALTGFGGIIQESARLTERRIELSESELMALNEKLTMLARNLPAECEVTHFLPDTVKEGGRYVSQRVKVKQILPDQCQIVLDDGQRIDLDNVLDLEVTGNR